MQKVTVEEKHVNTTDDGPWCRIKELTGSVIIGKVKLIIRLT